MDAAITIKQEFRESPFGLIPLEWNSVFFKEIARFYSGGTPLTSIKNYYDGEIPFIKSGEINSIKTKQYISKDGLNNSSAKFVKKGDLLLALYGANSGEVAISKINGAINQAVLCISTEQNKVYLLNFLISNKHRIINKYLQGGQGNLSGDIIKSLKIPLPPLPEQQKIAEILSTWDKGIEQTQNLITQLKERKKGLMQQLLTGKKRLSGFSGDWEEVRLGNHLIKHNEISKTSNQYPVLTSSRKGIFFQTDYYTREVASKNNKGYNVVPRGYFTYRHMSDDLVFKFNINTICDKGIVSTLYPVFSTKESLNKNYLLHMLNEGNEFKRHALQQKQGGSRTYMYFGKLCELKLPLPSLEEQIEIVKFTSASENEIKLHESKLETLKSQKKGLMEQLLTGKTRVKA